MAQVRHRHVKAHHEAARRPIVIQHPIELPGDAALRQHRAEPLPGWGRDDGGTAALGPGQGIAPVDAVAGEGHLPPGYTVPCQVVTDEQAAEMSLAENVVRLAMHPADQFEAFAALHRGGEGLGVEEIAARFGVSAHTVRQRLRLAAVSPAIVAAYREGALTLDHVTAFAVTDDREAQERVFAGLAEWQRTPATIRRLLTDALLPTTDRRVALVGLDAYEAAGGRVQRDLFSEDGGGWIADPALLEELVGRRMEAEAEAVRAEGWRWVAVGAEASDALWRCRRIWPARAPLTEAEEARRDALSARYDELAEGHGGTDDDLPEAVAAELDAIEAELDALEAREAAWRPEDLALAGALVTLAGDGRLAVTRGLLRPEDEPKPAAPHADGRDEEDGEGLDSPGTGEAEAPAAEGDAEDKAPALSAALVAELRAHRTLGLQAELAGRPDLALRVLLHALAGDAFYGRYGDAVASFPAHPPAFAGVVRRDSWWTFSVDVSITTSAASRSGARRSRSRRMPSRIVPSPCSGCGRRTASNRRTSTASLASRKTTRA